MPLHPTQFRVHPPRQSIHIVETDGDMRLLEFDSSHRFWFPSSMDVSAELWTEYLVAFWNHKANHHYYLRGNITLGPADLVFDAGSCEGFFARQALDLGVSKVICIEPSEIMARCLERTFSREIETSKVIIERLALGPQVGTSMFQSSDDNAFSGHLGGKSGMQVRITTIDDLAEKYGSPSLVKMDLEGYEYAALTGGISTMRRGHPKLAITTYHNCWDYSALHALLAGNGYRHIKPYGMSLREDGIPRPTMIFGW